MPNKPPTFRDPRLQAAMETWRAQHRQQHDRQRGSAAKRGYDGRWQKYARAYLQRHPWCVCERCTASQRPLPATHVDHIIAVSGPDDRLFWQPTNHRPMAGSCHSRKTVRQDGGFGRPPSPPPQR